MAQSISLQSGSPLIGSPVFFTVLADNLSQVPNLTFHRVILEVEVNSIGSGQSGEKYPLSAPVNAEGGSNYIQIDISSALRAKADDYEYTPHSTAGESIPYPIYTAKVKAWDEYMSNGIQYQSQEYSLDTTFYFLLGAFTDRERLATNGSRGVSTLTRKPATGELVAPGAGIYVYPPAYTYSVDDFFTGTQPSAPTTTALNKNSLTPGAAQTIAGRSVWVANDEDCEFVQFQFINGYGVLESAFAVTYPEASVVKGVKEYTVMVPMAFNKVNRNVSRKSASRHVFKMSSGPVTEEWQAWWQEEFLNTPQAWMYYKQAWVPVSIIPEETTNGIDRSGDNLPTVEFEVKLNIEGV